MEACVCQPIDTIKTRLQLDHHKKYSGHSRHFQWYPCECRKASPLFNTCCRQRPHCAACSMILGNLNYGWRDFLRCSTGTLASRQPQQPQ